MIIINKLTTITIIVNIDPRILRKNLFLVLSNNSTGFIPIACPAEIKMAIIILKNRESFIK